MEDDNDDLIEERLRYAEADIKAQQKVIADLLEYLVRTDANFKTSSHSFDSWTGRLDQMRQDDRIQKEVHQAKQCLANNGYLVVKDPSEIDAARVKKWVQTPTAKIPPDEDIPF